MVRVAAVTLVLLAVGCDDRTHPGYLDDRARMVVTKLAREAYPMWLVRPANNAKICPDLTELLEVIGLPEERRDPWKREYQIRCTDLPPGAVGIDVFSLGADGKEGTRDDIRLDY